MGPPRYYKKLWILGEVRQQISLSPYGQQGYLGFDFHINF